MHWDLEGNIKGIRRHLWAGSDREYNKESSVSYESATEGVNSDEEEKMTWGDDDHFPEAPDSQPSVDGMIEGILRRSEGKEKHLVRRHYSSSPEPAPHSGSTAYTFPSNQPRFPSRGQTDEFLSSNPTRDELIDYIHKLTEGYERHTHPFFLSHDSPPPLDLPDMIDNGLHFAQPENSQHLHRHLPTPISSANRPQTPPHPPTPPLTSSDHEQGRRELSTDSGQEPDYISDHSNMEDQVYIRLRGPWFE
ncbi:hypothetical protein IAR55_003718 [Kwoniella newhampshirensis]|uniref:Uncharacterized protein n=1 Tax=Kwoniella newhampshirensis TaxID=1651941 RepID=A0AAW0YZJ8_9TREE